MGPESIGRYEVVRELGHGGMATVYLGRDPLMKRQVAVKVLPVQFTFDPQFRQRFQREAEVIASLEHPGIVPVHDFGEQDGRPFIVMRYMPGGSLADRVKPGGMATAEIALFLQRLGAAVDYAHSRGVIHRDIKPGNILFDAQGEPYLSDFGIARMIESTAGFTGTGILGTPEYMSPEQARGEKNLDGRSDLYSLGVVLFHLLTGELPYVADTPMGTALAHITEPVPDIREIRPDLPPAWGRVISTILAKDPAGRYPSAAALNQAVNQAIAGDNQAATWAAAPSPAKTLPARAEPASDRPTGQGSAPDSNRRKRGFVWLLAGGAALLICALLGVVAASTLLPKLFAAEPPAASATEPQAVSVAAVTPTPPASATPPQPSPQAPAVGLSRTYVEYILDASGSMLENLGGKTRLQAAQEVLAERVAALPPGVQVGLRVYGHRLPYQNNEEESCKDIELVVPIQPDGRETVITWLPTMQARGMTPMTDSIRLAAEDFTFEPGRHNFILLISDGIETCGQEPAEAVAYLQELGVDFTIHVIGLAVDGQARAQLERLAQAGGGVYHDANSEADLREALTDVQGRLAEVELSEQGQSEQPQQTAAISPTSGPPTGTPTPTSLPETNTDITSEGVVEASTVYSAEFPTGLSVDGDRRTSWFSAGPGADGTTTYQWIGARDDLITSVAILSNREHARPDFRTGFGFGQVRIQVLDAAGAVVFDEVVELPGTPDPDVSVSPGVVGRQVVLIFSGHEDPTCGGIGELEIGAAR